MGNMGCAGVWLVGCAAVWACWVCRGVGVVRLDGAAVAGLVPLLDDGRTHLVEVTLDGKDRQ